MTVTKEIVWAKLLAMKDEESRVVRDPATAKIIADIVHTREPFDNGFTISYNPETGMVHKSFFIMPEGCQFCANSIWGDYFKGRPAIKLK